MIIAVHTTQPPHHPTRELYIHRMQHQINLWSCLNNNINVEDNNDNNNNKNNNNNNNDINMDNNNKTTSKQLIDWLIFIES